MHNGKRKKKKYQSIFSFSFLSCFLTCWALNNSHCDQYFRGVTVSSEHKSWFHMAFSAAARMLCAPSLFLFLISVQLHPHGAVTTQQTKSLNQLRWEKNNQHR